MARVLALIPDLLFGSRVQAALDGAGHAVVLVSDASQLGDRAREADVVVIDLTGPDSSELLSAVGTRSELRDVRTLGFYAHVDVELRRRAEQAGFDLVVPRSRMAREGAELVTRLAASDSSS